MLLKTWVFIAVFILIGLGGVNGQTVVDKSVATVSDGVRTELITYSDLLWQLALQPGTAIDPPSSEDLNRALQLQINQRLFALEADRLPRAAPTEAEINREIADLLAFFPSTAEFERRLRAVGLKSVQDENFVRIIRQRLSIDKYLSFRFRSFIVITPDELRKYYNEVFVPDFQRKFRGAVVPSFDERQAEISNILTEQRVAANIETFLDEAKRRSEVVILTEV